MAASGEKLRGFLMISAALTAIVLMVLSATVVGLYSGVFSMLEGSRTASTAQQYAEIDANALTLLPYDELLSAAHGKTDITGVDGWQNEIMISAEKVVSEDNRQRIGTVKVYKMGESIARASLQVPLSSQRNINFKGNIDDNGWIEYPNGLILQWGHDPVPTYNGQQKIIEFPNKFPNKCFSVVISMKMPYAITGSVNANLVSFGKNSFTFVNESDSFGGGTQGLTWYAIGY